MQYRLLPYVHPRDIFFIDLSRDAERRTAGKHEHGLPHWNKLTDLPVAPNDQAVGGRRERHEVALGAGALQRGFGRVQLGTRPVQLDLRQQVAAHQFLRALILRAGEARTRSQFLYHVVQVHIVKPGKRLSLAHPAPFVDIELDQVSGLPWRDRQHDRWFHGTGRVNRLHGRAARRRYDGDGDRSLAPPENSAGCGKHADNENPNPFFLHYLQGYSLQVQVSALRRHSDIRITAQVYARLAPENIRQAVSVLDTDRFVSGSVGRQALDKGGKRLIRWWAMLGSNQRPLPCEGSALPLS